MKDEMTPKERRQALLKGQAVDRLPITVSHEIYSAKLVGLNYREAFNAPENVAEKEMNLYRTYGIDGISVSYTSVNFGIRHRSKIKSLQFSTASIDIPRLNKVEDWTELNPEHTEFKRDVAQKVNYEAIQIMQGQVGQEIDIVYSISAPFTMATGVVAAEQLLRAMFKQPDEVHGLMNFVTESIKRIIDKASSLGIKDFFIYDPVASGSLIGPKQYQKFSQPYTREIIDYIREKSEDSWVGMHICGNTTDRLDLIADTGIDAFSLDQKVNLLDAKQAIGDRITLMGNVDPVEIFLQGTPEQMDQAVKECYDQARDTPAGFILRSGCGIPYESPQENFDAYFEAAKKYSRL